MEVIISKIKGLYKHILQCRTEERDVQPGPRNWLVCTIDCPLQDQSKQWFRYKSVWYWAHKIYNLAQCTAKKQHIYTSSYIQLIVAMVPKQSEIMCSLLQKYTLQSDWLPVMYMYIIMYNKLILLRLCTYICRWCYWSHSYKGKVPS